MQGDEHWAFGLGIVLTLMICFFAGLANGLRSQRSFEAEAVKHGAATWSVDENGNRVFKWKGQE